MKSSLFAILTLLTLPAVALAGGSEGFVPLVGIPGLTGLPTFDDYIDALYALAISVAALIAVVQIVIGGAEYMMSDLITKKSNAKERIKNALIGLLIIIAAALILTTINSDLTRLSISAPVIDVDNSRPDPIAYIDSVAAMATQAIARNTEMVTAYCNGDLLNPITYVPLVGGLAETCAAECSQIPGVMNYSGRNSCTYLQDDADRCDAQRSEFCCSYIKGGAWSGQGCSLADAEQARIRACYDGGRTWDTANNTCRTTACNPQTDQRCCEIFLDGTFTNGTCTTPENVITGEAACLAQTGWTWRNGLCIQLNTDQFEFQPVVGNGDPYTYCLRLGDGWEYNEPNNNCQRFIGN